MVGTLCAELVQFYNDQFEILPALLSWFVDVHMILALSSVRFLAPLFKVQGELL